VVVRAATGKFVTQRQQPRLALVEVSITPEQLLQGADIAACPDAKLVLRAPGMEQLEARAAGGRKLLGKAGGCSAVVLATAWLAWDWHPLKM
jgi:hypothetical protein